MRGERFLFPTGWKRGRGPQATLFVVWANLCLGLRKWCVAFSSDVTITAMRSRFSGPDLPGSHCFQLAFYQLCSWHDSCCVRFTISPLRRCACKVSSGSSSSRYCAYLPLHLQRGDHLRHGFFMCAGRLQRTCAGVRHHETVTVLLDGRIHETIQESSISESLTVPLARGVRRMTLLLGSAASRGLMSAPYGPSGAPPGSPARSLSTESEPRRSASPRRTGTEAPLFDGTIGRHSLGKDNKLRDQRDAKRRGHP